MRSCRCPPQSEWEAENASVGARISWSAVRPGRPVEDVYQNVGAGETAYDASLRHLSRTRSGMLARFIANTLFYTAVPQDFSAASWPSSEVIAVVALVLLGAAGVQPGYLVRAACGFHGGATAANTAARVSKHSCPKGMDCCPSPCSCLRDRCRSRSGAAVDASSQTQVGLRLNAGGRRPSRPPTGSRTSGCSRAAWSPSTRVAASAGASARGWWAKAHRAIGPDGTIYLRAADGGISALN